MNEYKSLNKYFDKKKIEKKVSNNNNLLQSFFSKILICLIMFMFFLIGDKTSSSFKSTIYENVYNNTFGFAMVKEWYTSSFGDVFPFDNILPSDTQVFSEKLVYDSANLYKDGVALKVSQHYLVPLINSGVVVYVGEKDGYGSTVIVQEENGINVWYSNINYGDIKMYDYVEKGNFVGEAIDTTVYLIFQKDGEFLDYKEYI